ncbi:MAG: phosphoribosylformylglycinamidine synthase I [Rhodospirillales bacterium 12-54-5]|nr:MAG: phosphoribosylformylglycinamidine synthase I [Rhodospirillales bacterium 12-54-5]
MRSAVIVFPGSNCDRDVFTVMQQQGLNPEKVWHDDATLPAGLDLVVLPGGFSFGDYLRCGAMAARSPIMQDVIKFAGNGGYVLGICNGFQILTESGLLPGTLMRNNHLQFNCKETTLRVEANDTVFTKAYAKHQVIHLPVAHAEGNYFADDATLRVLNDNNQIAFRYVNDVGKPTEDANPNGACDNIAGIFNKNRNVLGLMPHPERHADAALGGTDGALMFQSFLAA